MPGSTDGEWFPLRRRWRWRRRTREAQSTGRFAAAGGGWLSLVWGWLSTGAYAARCKALAKRLNLVWGWLSTGAYAARCKAGYGYFASDLCFLDSAKSVKQRNPEVGLTDSKQMQTNGAGLDSQELLPDVSATWLYHLWALQRSKTQNLLGADHVQDALMYSAPIAKLGLIWRFFILHFFRLYLLGFWL